MHRAVLFLILLLIVCTANVAAEDSLAYVLNTTGEAVSRINLNTGEVVNNIVTIGSTDQSYPNQMVIRDTLLYVVASGTNEIQVINLNDELTVSYFNLPLGSNPYWMDFENQHYLYVSLLLNNTVARIDCTSGMVDDEIPVGKSPEGVLVAGDKVYVACTGFDFDTWLYDPGEIYVYDIIGDSITAQISVGLNPQFFACDRLGRIHVVCTGDYYSVFGVIYIIDPTVDSVVDSIKIDGTPGHISIGSDDVAYLAAAGFTQDGYVFSYNSLTGEIYHNVINPIVVDLNCMTVAAFQDSTVFTASFTDYVKVIDSSGNNLASYAVGAGPQHIVFNYASGDANGDFEINLLDITHILTWLYKAGDPPKWPKWRANANADRNYNLLDITYLINFLYKGGDRPKPPPTWM